MISDYINLNNILILIICYIWGSVPTAYLVVKYFTKKNILLEGTGNVGAMNSYDVTGKKWIGIFVFLLDSLKGLIGAYVARRIGWDIFLSTSIGVFCLVLGHNYSIFLKFKGGRGLSTAFGALLIINPYAIIAWFILWLIGYYAIHKHVHVANIVAIVLTPFMVYSTPEFFTYNLTFVPYAPKLAYEHLITAICILFILKHIKPLKDLVKNNFK